MWQSFWDAIEKLFQQDTAAIAGQFDAVALSDLSKLAQGCGMSILSRDAQTSLLKVIFSTSSGETLRDAGEIMWTMTHNLSSISWASSRVYISKTPHVRTTLVNVSTTWTCQETNRMMDLFIYRLSGQRKSLSVMLWHHQRDDKDFTGCPKTCSQSLKLTGIRKCWELYTETG